MRSLGSVIAEDWPDGLCMSKAVGFFVVVDVVLIGGLASLRAVRADSRWSEDMLLCVCGDTKIERRDQTLPGYGSLGLRQAWWSTEDTLGFVIACRCLMVAQCILQVGNFSRCFFELSSQMAVRV